MLKDHIHSISLSIVIIGEFNPMVFQPFWLSEKKLIRDGEASSADIEIIHNQISKFKLDWASIEVTNKRFEIRVHSEPFFEPARDLVTGIFNYLKETPLSNLGINHVLNFSMPTDDLYYEFGNKLSSLKMWSDFLSNSRLGLIEIIQNPRTDNLPGLYRIRVYPSEETLDIKRGVTINLNDHFGLSESDTGRKLELLKILNDQWVTSMDKANSIVENIWQKII